MAWMMWALLLAQDVGKEDVVRLTKEGKTEAEILQAIGTASFRLSVDDVVELKKAGVGEKVLARMVSGPSLIAVENLAHKAVRIRVRDGTIEVGAGEELRPGQAIRLPGTGEFAITVDGRPRNSRVKTPATLTFRGCDVEKFEVITLYIEGPGGGDTCLIENRIKESHAPQGYAPAPPPPTPYRVRRGAMERVVDYVGGIPGRVSDVLFGW
jgi:hypothetical protein